MLVGTKYFVFEFYEKRWETLYLIMGTISYVSKKIQSILKLNVFDINILDRNGYFHII